jgi:hypothetical protein
MSETVFCNFETAAAHAEDDRAVEEKVRLEGRILVDSMRKRHCGHTARAVDNEGFLIEGTSRKMRGLKIGGGIEEISTR